MILSDLKFKLLFIENCVGVFFLSVSHCHICIMYFMYLCDNLKQDVMCNADHYYLLKIRVFFLVKIFLYIKNMLQSLINLINKKWQNDKPSCKKCGENVYWCKPCLINNLKTTNLASVNEQIGRFVQDIELKNGYDSDILFVWIPYDQFNRNNEIGRGRLSTVYSAIWKDGPLKYDKNTEKYIK